MPNHLVDLSSTKVWTFSSSTKDETQHYVVLVQVEELVYNTPRIDQNWLELLIKAVVTHSKFWQHKGNLQQKLLL